MYQNSLVNYDIKKEKENTQQLVGYHWGKNEQNVGELSSKKILQS